MSQLVLDPGVERRGRFRQSVGALSTRARAGDLTRAMLLPGAAFLLIGFNFLLFGWWGAAHTARQIEQIPYLISGGLIGVALIFVGGLILVSALWMVMLRRIMDEAEERGARRVLEAVPPLWMPPVEPQPEPHSKTESVPAARRPVRAASRSGGAGSANGTRPR